MRTFVTAGLLLVSLGLLMVAPVFAGELMTAKVYRDYPGYINPAVCENPNTGKAMPTPAQPAASASADAAPAASAPMQPAAPAPSQPCCSSFWGERADDPDGHYLSVWAGLTATRDLEVTRNIDMSVDNGYGTGIAIGYDFGRGRLEVEGSYRKANGGKGAPEDLEVFTALVNGYLDFPTGGPITPYVGAGGGYARAELDSDAHDEFGAGQVAAGFLFAVNPRVAVDLGYKLLFPITKSDYELQQHTAALGVQIRF